LPRIIWQGSQIKTQAPAGIQEELASWCNAEREPGNTAAPSVNQGCRVVDHLFGSSHRTDRSVDARQNTVKRRRFTCLCRRHAGRGAVR
jgi:hypothetical protein